MEDTLAFVQEEGYMEDLVCQVVNTDTQHKTIGATAEDSIKEHTLTRSCKKRKNQRTKGTIFSRGFIKRIIRKISTSDTGWRTAEDLKR